MLNINIKKNTENINQDGIQNSQIKRLSNENPDKMPKTEERPFDQNNQSIGNQDIKASKLKPWHIFLIAGIALVVIIIVIVVIVVVTKKKDDDDDAVVDDDYTKIIIELNEKNHISASKNDDFVIPSDKKVQVVGADFPQKSNTYILDKNKNIFKLNNDGKIEGITKDAFPLYISFNESITNASYLFKDVQCFKTIDLSKMDSSKLIDISNMFENSKFEEIYFGTENESKSQENTNGNNRYLEENDNPDSENEELDFLEEEEEESDNEKRKEYFDTKNIESASNIFNNCVNLKKIQFPPSFNVGKSAKGMFKGCVQLVEVNTSLISSTEVEEMESMFEDCKSLKEIVFSNDFLTGEIKSLMNAFVNTNLINLDISYLRLYNLENSLNIFKGASIRGNLKIGKYFKNDELRDNLFKEIAKVTDSKTQVFTPSGTTIDQVFKDIYFSEKNEIISVTVIDIDYNISYKQDSDYKLYSSKLYFGLGWDYDSNNTYDLDSSVLTFTRNLTYLSNVYFGHLQEYDGSITLSGDDLTGEGDGDDEVITVLLDSLPPEVEIFTVQLNSFRGNSLKNVKSAYLRISTDIEDIGSYSITDAGDNIGLLIGCFFKSSNSWYFKPLNKVVPGYKVLESLNSVQENLHLLFDNRLISAIELVKRLQKVANDLSVYSQKPKYNSLYWNGTHWFADCSNLIKSIINGRDVYNPKYRTYQKQFPVVEDVNANNLILKCNNVSTNFTELKSGVPRLLHLKDNNGNGHVGVYLGTTIYYINGTVNVIEATTSWGANAVIYSWVDQDGTRRLYEEGPLSEMKYNWTSHGSLDQWVW